MWLLLPFLITIHVIICLLMVLVVLMQRPRNEGLGAAFGGGMTDSLFGAQTTNVLAKFTVWMGIGFFGLTLLLSVVYAKATTSKSAIQKEVLAAAAASASATPSPTPVASPSATPAVVAPVQAVPVESATPAPSVAPEATPTPAASATP